MIRSIIKIINILWISIILISCNKNDIYEKSDLESINDSYESLAINYTSGNDESYVTKDLELINEDKTNKVVITWESDKENVVSSSGLVTRFNFNIKVTLTASLKKGSYQLDKVFIVNVIKNDITQYDHILEDGIYNQKNDVVVYILFYEKLPDNYLTKSEVDGHISNYWTKDNMLSIGGDRFYNYERLLPEWPGRLYYEADINYQGESRRNAERIVYSNDGLVFYTNDHYDSFVMFDKELEIWS